MIGYHYTTYNNWLKIQIEGLIPYKINKPELNVWFPKIVQGIWLWPKNLTGTEHAGSVLWQVATKGQTKIVKLRCNFNKKDLLHHEDGLIKLTHKGWMLNWKYHENTPGLIITKPISPRCILKVGYYDIIELLSKRL